MVMTVLSLVLAAAATGPREIQTYSYTDSEGHLAHWIIDESTGRNKFVYGSYISSLVDCESEQLRVCVRGEVFAFSLPAEELQKGLEWTADQYRFFVEDCVELSFFGISVNAWKIISHPSGVDVDRAVYYYSNELGLVGFSVSSTEEGIVEQTGETSSVLIMRTFWLATKVGYFAIQP